jgi:hypothetical protein
LAGFIGPAYQLQHTDNIVYFKTIEFFGVLTELRQPGWVGSALVFASLALCLGFVRLAMC